ncbi:MAG: MFS transporter, partial [Armatimonadetes bacterium]|nr:MFS transporter [Armatimonadota bacterium]
TMLWAVVLYAAAMIGFGLSTSYPLSLLLLAVTGATDSVSAVIRGTIRQLVTPDELRGRMTSVNMLFFVGGPHLGEVEVGALAQFMGVGPAVAVGGVACLGIVGWIAARTPELRSYDQ